MKELPKISCLCVSQNRSDFLKKAISYFNQQTYPNRDLVIVYEGDDNFLNHPLLKNDRIKIITVGDTSITLGERRNIAIQNCDGDFFCHWDDDDWYHNKRLAIQLKSLQENNLEACVLDRLILYNNLTNQAYLSSKRSWEGSLLCKTEIVKGRLEYPRIQKGEDHALVTQLINRDCVHAISAPYLYIYLFHGKNTWHQNHFQQLFDAGYELNLDDNLLIQKTLEGEYSHDSGSKKLAELEFKIKGYVSGKFPEA